MSAMNPEREQMIESLMGRPNMLGGQGPEGRYTREQAEAQADHIEKTMPIAQPEGIGKVLDTKGIKTLTRIARQRNYNRILSDEMLARLDPDGRHFVGGMVIPHEHAQGRRVPLHMRCQWLLKLRNQTEPLEVLLDTPLEVYEAIPMIRKDESGEWVMVTPDEAREVLVHRIAGEQS